MPWAPLSRYILFALLFWAWVECKRMMRSQSPPLSIIGFLVFACAILFTVVCLLLSSFCNIKGYSYSWQLEGKFALVKFPEDENIFIPDLQFDPLSSVRKQDQGDVRRRESDSQREMLMTDGRNHHQFHESPSSAHTMHFRQMLQICIPTFLLSHWNWWQAEFLILFFV